MQIKKSFTGIITLLSLLPMGFIQNGNAQSPSSGDGLGQSVASRSAGGNFSLTKFEPNFQPNSGDALESFSFAAVSTKTAMIPSLLYNSGESQYRDAGLGWSLLLPQVTLMNGVWTFFDGNRKSQLLNDAVGIGKHDRFLRRFIPVNSQLEQHFDDGAVVIYQAFSESESAEVQYRITESRDRFGRWSKYIYQNAGEQILLTKVEADLLPGSPPKFSVNFEYDQSTPRKLSRVSVQTTQEVTSYELKYKFVANAYRLSSIEVYGLHHAFAGKNVYSYFQTGMFTGLLQSVKNPLGGVRSITYAVTPVGTSYKAVVNRMTEDPIVGNPFALEIGLSGASMVNGSVEFAHVEALAPNQTKTVTQYFTQDSIRNGLWFKNTVFDSLGRKTQEDRRFFEVGGFDQQSIMPFLDVKSTYASETQNGRHFATQYTNDFEKGVVTTILNYGEVSSVSDNGGIWENSYWGGPDTSKDNTTQIAEYIDLNEKGLRNQLKRKTLLAFDSKKIAETVFEYGADGNPEWVKTWDNQKSKFRALQSNFDSLGNVIQTKSPAGKIVQFQYQSDSVQKITLDPWGANLETKFEYNPITRVLENAIAPSGISIKIARDDLGRIRELKKWNIGATQSKSLGTYSYGQNGVTHNESQNWVSVQQPGGQTSKVYLDGLGRTILQKTSLNETEQVAKEIAYGLQAQLSKISGGYLSSSDSFSLGEASAQNSPAFSRLYDATGALTEIHPNQNGNGVGLWRFIKNSNGYPGSMKVVDPSQKGYELFSKDVLTSLLKFGNGNQETTFEIASNLSEQVLEVKNQLGNSGFKHFNSMGEIAAQTFIQGGSINYERNDDSQVTRTTDSNGNISQFEYDGVGRPIQTEATLASDGSKETTRYWYTNLSSDCLIPRGALSVVSGPNDAWVYCYDDWGQLDRAGQLDVKTGESYFFWFKHDDQGRLIRQTYPNGSYIDYTFDTINGKIKNIKSDQAIYFGQSNDLIAQYNWSKDGIEHILYGSGLEQSNTYWPNSSLPNQIFLKQNSLNGTAVNLADIHHYYDDLNLTTVTTETWPSGVHQTITENYSYDSRGLPSGVNYKVFGTEKSYPIEFDFASRLTKNAADLKLQEFHYENNAHPYSPSSLSPVAGENGVVYSLEYDSMGNITKLPGARTATYDAEGKLKTIKNEMDEKLEFDWSITGRLMRVRSIHADGSLHRISTNLGLDSTLRLEQDFSNSGSEEIILDVFGPTGFAKEPFGKIASYAWDAVTQTESLEGGTTSPPPGGGSSSPIHCKPPLILVNGKCKKPRAPGGGGTGSSNPPPQDIVTHTTPPKLPPPQSGPAKKGKNGPDPETYVKPQTPGGGSVDGTTQAPSADLYPDFKTIVTNPNPCKEARIWDTQAAFSLHVDEELARIRREMNEIHRQIESLRKEQHGFMTQERSRMTRELTTQTLATVGLGAFALTGVGAIAEAGATGGLIAAGTTAAKMGAGAALGAAAFSGASWGVGETLGPEAKGYFDLGSAGLAAGAGVYGLATIGMPRGNGLCPESPRPGTVPPKVGPNFFDAGYDKRGPWWVYQGTDMDQMPMSGPKLHMAFRRGDYCKAVNQIGDFLQLNGISHKFREGSTISDIPQLGDAGQFNKHLAIYIGENTNPTELAQQLSGIAEYYGLTCPMEVIRGDVVVAPSVFGRFGANFDSWVVTPFGQILRDNRDIPYPDVPGMKQWWDTHVGTTSPWGL